MSVICENCTHWVPEYAPYIKRMVMTCELPKRNIGCVGDYDPIKPSRRRRKKKNENDS